MTVPVSDAELSDDQTDIYANARELCYCPKCGPNGKPKSQATLYRHNQPAEPTHSSRFLSFLSSNAVSAPGQFTHAGPSQPLRTSDGKHDGPSANESDGNSKRRKQHHSIDHHMVVDLSQEPDEPTTNARSDSVCTGSK